jgi:hypothetical protein
MDWSEQKHESNKKVTAYKREKTDYDSFCKQKLESRTLKIQYQKKKRSTKHEELKKLQGKQREVPHICFEASPQPPSIHTVY